MTYFDVTDKDRLAIGIQEMFALRVGPKFDGFPTRSLRGRRKRIF